jgi:hypothetical protein
MGYKEAIYAHEVSFTGRMDGSGRIIYRLKSPVLQSKKYGLKLQIE